MLFTSIEFVVYLVTVFVLYWFVFNRYKLLVSNLFLIFASLVFYGWWNWKCAFLLIAIGIITYVAGYGIRVLREKGFDENIKWYKNWIFLIHLSAILLCIGTLGFFKYYNFFVKSFASIWSNEQNLSFSTLNIILPIGISFYIFQALTYSIDVYLKKMEPTKDLVSYFAFVTFFPPLLSGPIGRAKTLIPKFSMKRVFDFKFASLGCLQFLWGLFVKVCIADRISLYVDTIYGNLVFHNGTSILLAAVFYSFQIYCDFLGYSLMALGVAKLFGIELINNFNRPYFATSVTDFWRRWHISLSTWFRDYIYIPLGGNRVSEWRHSFNIFVTFLVSGLWHGAAWTFVLWGSIHGLFQIVGKQKNKYLKLPENLIFTAFDILITFLLVTFAWIIFRIPNIDDAVFAIKKIFLKPGIPFVDSSTFFYGILGILLLLIVDVTMEYIMPKNNILTGKFQKQQFLLSLILVFIILFIGVFGGGQFIYFQF